MEGLVYPEKSGDTINIYNIFNSQEMNFKKEEMTDISKNNINYIGSNATVTNSQMIAGSKVRDIITTVNNSNAPNELKDLLKSLSEEMKKFVESEGVDNNTAQRMTKDLESFTNEALDPSPRREFLDVIWGGLKKSATAVVNVAKFGIENWDKISLIADKIMSILP